MVNGVSCAAACSGNASYSATGNNTYCTTCTYNYNCNTNTCNCGCYTNGTCGCLTLSYPGSSCNGIVTASSSTLCAFTTVGATLTYVPGYGGDLNITTYYVAPANRTVFYRYNGTYYLADSDPGGFPYGGYSANGGYLRNGYDGLASCSGLTGYYCCCT
jgi:hypothetical protein